MDTLNLYASVIQLSYPLVR